MNALIAGLAVLLFAQSPVRLAPGTGIVMGTIQMDVEGSMAGVRVAVVATDDPTSSNLVSLTETDSTGRFRLTDIPQGHYFVVAGPVNNLTYFPGGFDRTKAREIVVDAAKTLANINFKVPADSRRPPPDKSTGAKSAAEFNAYDQASKEGKSNARIAMLLSFEKNFPQSSLLPRVYEDLVDLYSAQGDLKSAIVYGDKLLEKEPENVRALVKVSRAYGLNQAYLRPALQYAEKAVTLAAKMKSLPPSGRPEEFRGYSPAEWNKIVASLDESAKSNLVWVKQVVAWNQAVLDATFRTRR
jgi:hypothetical protein